MSARSAIRYLDSVLVVCGRELAAYGHAPIAYVVSVLFLGLQGFSFWAVVRVLADPAHPAPVGAVLQSHFGGTFVHWTVLVVVVAVLSMRLVAEDRRQGIWEALVTAPVTESAVIAGKWLAALGFYGLLWLPTLLYPVILHHYAPPSAAIDPGPVASAYLGVFVIGAGFLAIGVAASAATANQIIAAVITFAAAMGLILVAELPGLLPDWQAQHPVLAQIVSQIAVREHMEQFARGLIAARALVFCAGLVVLGLVAATTAAIWGRRRVFWDRVLAGALVAVIVVCANILVDRHPVQWDVTATRVNSLDGRTRGILDDADAAFLRDGEPVRLVLVRAGLDMFAGVQGEVDRLLGRMVAGRPGLRLEALDPVTEPERLAALAAEFAVPVENLRDGGVVVVQRGDRRRAVDLMDMAGFARDDLGVGSLSRFAAEEALATAMSEVLDPGRLVVCATVGHGELLLTGAGEEGDSGLLPLDLGRAPSWAGLGRRIVREGGAVHAVDLLAAGVPEHCRVLVMAGPTRPLSAREAAAVAAYLARGGRLLLALSEALDPAGTAGRTEDASGTAPGFARTGLAVVLAEYGIAIPGAAVLDRDGAVDGPARWLTTGGYGDHPISASFRDRRLTVWLHPRAVLLSGTEAGSVRGSVLVQSSPGGWGETDPASVQRGQARPDPGDLDGPVSIAVAVAHPDTGARLVVVGGAHALAAAEDSAGELFAWSSLSWLGGLRQVVDIGEKTPEHVRLITPEHVRLIMTSHDLRRVFWLCVVLLPGLVAGIGAFFLWRRRRG